MSKKKKQLEKQLKEAQEEYKNAFENECQQFSGNLEEIENHMLPFITKVEKIKLELEKEINK